MRDRKELHDRRRGFTLTEVAIVLGIVGIILGAIWAAAAKVYANNKVAQADTEIMDIVQGIRATYGNQPSFPSGTQVLTGYAVTSGIIPSNTLSQQACGSLAYTSDAGQDPCPLDPWGGAIEVGTQTGWFGLPGSTSNFEIMFWNTLPQDGCAALMAQMIQNAKSSGLQAI
ncbi:MAG TPA: prepilin-type N-terminal cleavage/methylation domain-containing protein, partial [Alphaproteobacteria bacterium]|nr:prepilin-type N-terminal cleavage/methylation domain-containing protein [Alphaproteobacteria bacterium]